MQMLYTMPLPAQPQYPSQLFLFSHSNPTTSVQYCTVHQKASLIKGSEPKTRLTHTEQTQTVVYWYIITPSACTLEQNLESARHLQQSQSSRCNLPEYFSADTDLRNHRQSGYVLCKIGMVYVQLSIAQVYPMLSKTCCDLVTQSAIVRFWK